MIGKKRKITNRQTQDIYKLICVKKNRATFPPSNCPLCLAYAPDPVMSKL